MNPWQAERERLRSAIEALQQRQAELPSGTDPAAVMARYQVDQAMDPLKVRLREIRDL